MKVYHLVLALCVVTAGCDHISGVSTGAELATPIDYKCVDRTIRAVEGVGEVSLHEDQDESFQVMPYRGKVISKRHIWLYGPGQTASLQITDDGLKKDYENGMMKMGPRWPASRLDAFIPLMKRVNDAVAQGCGLPISMIGKVTRS